MPALINSPVLDRPNLHRATTTHRCGFCCRPGENYVETRHDWCCPDCFSRRWFNCAECGALKNAVDGYNFEHGTGEIVRVCRDCRSRLTTWDATPMAVSVATYTQIGSKRKFGVEIETSACGGHRSLRGNTLFGTKFDCSVNGMEFDSPILYGDEGLAEVTKICGYAADKHWEVDSDCGLHIHLDMRDESVEALKSVAYAYLLTDKVWRKLVDGYRADNCTYCRPSNRGRRNIESASDWRDYCDSQSRYELCNLNAYTRHGTYEIRLYQGSIDSVEINNWIIIHARFVDWAAGKTLDELDAYFAGSDNIKWEGLKLILGEFPLVKYWIGKRRRGRNNETRLAPSRRLQDEYDDAAGDGDDDDE